MCVRERVRNGERDGVCGRVAGPIYVYAGRLLTLTFWPADSEAASRVPTIPLPLISSPRPLPAAPTCSCLSVCSLQSAPVPALVPARTSDFSLQTRSRLMNASRAEANMKLKKKKMRLHTSTEGGWVGGGLTPWWGWRIWECLHPRTSEPTFLSDARKHL